MCCFEHEVVTFDTPPPLTARCGRLPSAETGGGGARDADQDHEPHQVQLQLNHEHCQGLLGAHQGPEDRGEGSVRHSEHGFAKAASVRLRACRLDHILLLCFLNRNLYAETTNIVGMYGGVLHDQIYHFFYP